jgi:hypothetical protein
MSRRGDSIGPVRAFKHLLYYLVVTSVTSLASKEWIGTHHVAKNGERRLMR